MRLRIEAILRMVRSRRPRLIFEMLFRGRAQSGMASVFMITFLMLSLSSIGVLIAEDAEQSNIRTAEDAAWWSLTTITTVGYGDRYPVTLPGRLITGALMITGVGLLGRLSGVVARFPPGTGCRGQRRPQPRLSFSRASTPWNRCCETRLRQNRIPTCRPAGSRPDIARAWPSSTFTTPR